MELDRLSSTYNTIRSLGALAPDEECIYDFGIVDGVCASCQSFRDFAINPSKYLPRDHHSLRNMLWADKLGCKVCHFVLGFAKQNYMSNRIDEFSQDRAMNDKTHVSGNKTNLRIRFLFASLWVELAAAPEDPFAIHNLPDRRTLSTHTTPEICKSFTQQQMSICGETHLSCPPITPKKMPKRVIDISPCEPASPVLIIPPRLITTEGRTDPWVALSYCWGSDGTMVTATKASISGLMEGINVAALPKTFRDAIVVMKAIGFRYLWIDALCILQDDPDDLANELAEMCNIYKNSALTLAIDGASSVSQGFLGPRITINSVKVPYHNAKHESKDVFEIRGQLPLRYKYDILGSRAWALQENILSPRTLHIGKQQLFWRCQSFSRSEGYLGPFIQYGSLSEGFLKRSFLQAEINTVGHSSVDLVDRTGFLLESWYRIVSNYAARSLSFATDTFPAIAGLAEEIQRQTNLIYRAGLWEQDVHRGLLWCAKRGVRPRDFQAPSWSWASLNLRDSPDIYHAITVGQQFQRLGDIISDVERVSFHMEGVIRPFTDTPGENSFVEIRAPWITASPAIWLERELPFCNYADTLFDMYSLNRENSREYTERGVTWERAKSGQIICHFDIEVDAPLEKRLRSVSYLLVANHDTPGLGKDAFSYNLLWCLMLVPTGNAEDEFERVGLARIPRHIVFREPEWETRTIKIF